MELKMNQMQLPEKVTFNYEELKQELQEKTELYASIVYGDAEIRQAKTDKANLNKLKKAMNDERIRQEKEYMKPFNEFKAQVNEIIGIIDKPIAVIDEQVKAYDEKQKADKLEKIKAYWETTEHPEWLQCNRIFDQRWLNTTFSLKKVQEAIDERLAQIEADVKTLESLPEYSFEAVEVYKQSLDMNRAIAEGQRLADIQKRKAEAEAEKERLQKEAGTQQVDVLVNVEMPDGSTAPIDNIKVEIPAKQWIGFEALLSVEDAKELSAFFNRNEIDFRMI